MKAGWENKKFGEVLEIRNGRNQREVESASGQYPIMGSAGKLMGYATDFICEAGTTIIGRKGTINSPIYAESRFWNVDTAFGLSPSPCLDSKFLHYFCLSYDFSLLNRGTTIPSLVKTDLLQIQIPLPPLDEQRRIVAVLDKAFAGIATATANAQKNLTNARALFESYQSHLFKVAGEAIVPLGEMASFRNGLNFTGSSKGEIIRIVGVKDFQNRLWIPDENLAQVQIDGKLADNDVLQEGDILTVRSNGNPELIGRCMVAPAMSAKTSHSGFTIRIRPDADKVDTN